MWRAKSRICRAKSTADVKTLPGAQPIVTHAPARHEAIYAVRNFLAAQSTDPPDDPGDHRRRGAEPDSLFLTAVRQCGPLAAGCDSGSASAAIRAVGCLRPSGHGRAGLLM